MSAIGDCTINVLRGVTAPIVTPIRPDGSVFPEATLRLLTRLALSRVDAILIAGSTGEGHALDTSALATLVEYVAPTWRRLTSGLGRVLVNVSAASSRETLHRAEAVAIHRPEAVMATPPYYFVHTERELIYHFEYLSAVGLPLIAYNVPRYTNNPLTRPIIARLAQLNHVVGIKDSSGDRDILQYACNLASVHGTSFAVTQGDEANLTSALRLGAQGIAPGLANLASSRCVALYNAAMAGDWATADQVQEDLRRLAAIHSIRRGVVATKTAMALQGWCPADATLPFEAFSDREIAELQAVLEQVAGIIDPPLEQS